jgi:MFS family permease
LSAPSRAAGGFGLALVAPLALGSLLNPINSSMIATALEPIGRAFSASVSETVWLVAGLYVTSAVAQPTMGRLADRWGARRVFLVGLVLVLLGGVAGALAPSLGALVGVRVLIGVGTSAAYPSAMRVLRTHARRIGRETPRLVLSVLSLAALSSMAVGPTLGGLLTGAAGWRAIFLVNVPLAAIGIVLCLLFVARDEPGERDARSPSFDLLGMALFAGAIVAIMFFAMDLKKTPRWSLVPIAGALFALLLVHSRRRSVAQPFIDVRMLVANKPLAATYLRFGVTCVLAYVVLYGFAQWMQGALGYSPAQAGVATLPLSITAMVTSLLTARTKTLRAPLALAAFALLAGCAGLLLLDDRGSRVGIAVVGVLFGVAQGTSSVGNQAAVYEQAPASEIATAAGLQRTAGYLGAVAASSLLGFFYGMRATTSGLHSLALTMTVLSALLCAGTLLDPSLRFATKQEPIR